MINVIMNNNLENFIQKIPFNLKDFIQKILSMKIYLDNYFIWLDRSM